MERRRRCADAGRLQPSGDMLSLSSPSPCVGRVQPSDDMLSLSSPSPYVGRG
jgi:hypothetical protein